MTELNPGVQILIDQLKLNPDHFFGPVDGASAPRVLRSPKFGHLCRMMEEVLIGREAYRINEDRSKHDADALWYLTGAERAALKDALIEARRERFAAEVIARLHHVEDQESDGTSMYVAKAIHGGTLTGMGSFGNVGAGGASTLTATGAYNTNAQISNGSR